MNAEIEALMGDESTGTVIVPKLMTPQQLQVNVRRLGLEVELTIGNADPHRMTWQEALRLGYHFGKEGAAASKAKRPAELKLGAHKLNCNGKVLITVGQWLMSKATEAKVLDGQSGKQIEM